MNAARLVTSTPLDDFLDESGAASNAGERLQRIGLFGSMTGIMLATGLVVFLLVVHRGSHREIARILRVITIAGVVALVGAAVEVLGLASIDDLGWYDAFVDAASSASMMRLLGALLVVFGVFDQVRPSTDGAGPTGEPVRWVPSSASAFGLAGIAIGVLSFWFDGHTVTEGPRIIHAVANGLHVAAGSVWFGGIVGLAVVAMMRRGTDESSAGLVVRFSTVASLALLFVAFAGTSMALLITDEIGDLTGTDWGRMLLVKVGVVGVTALIGGYNHFVVVPALDSGDASRSTRAESHIRRTLLAEAALLVLVIALTVVLSTASTS